MADQNTGAASAPTSFGGMSGFIGGFPPAPLAETPRAPEPQQAPEPQEPAEEPKVEAKPAEKPTGLAELIRKQREERLAREQESARAKDWESKYTELKSEVERMKRDSDFETDPVAYARARGWDKEKQALMGQMLLYDLVPDKAPPDLRIRLFEMKQAEEKRREQEQRSQQEQERAEAERAEMFNGFVGMVEQAVSAFEPGSYPESEAWFVNPETGESDPDTYLKSLVATAVNMAARAQRDGKVADLSPASIAKALEADIARRMTKRDERRQKVATPAPKGTPAVQQVLPKADGGVQPTESTKGTYGSGSPRPPALTEEERLARAAEVMFRTPGSR
jgi:hypothetical protein